MDTVTCHTCKTTAAYDTAAAASAARARHLQGDCQVFPTQAAYTNAAQKYGEEKARETLALRLADVYKAHYCAASHGLGLAQDERIVVCKPCKQLIRVHESNHKATVAFHHHAPGTATTPPPFLEVSPPTRTWIQASCNWAEKSLFHFTCGACRLACTYQKRDTTAALVHHLGEYCVRPSPLHAPALALVEDPLSIPMASTWMKEMEAVRDALTHTLQEVDSLQAQAATTGRCTPPPGDQRTKRPYNGDDAPTTPTKSLRGRPEDDESMNSDDEVSAPDTLNNTLSNTNTTPKGKPPPIHVDSDWGEDYFTKIDQYSTGLSRPITCKLAGRGGGLVLRTQNFTDYSTLTARLRAASESFTTKTPAHEKVERYVAKRLPTGIPESRILTELKAANTPALAVHRLTASNRRAGQQQPVILTAAVCSFPAGTPLKAVAAAAPTIGNCTVLWQRFDSRGEPMQCHNCQDYAEHSAKNCHRPTQCRKCSGYHRSADCTSTVTRCANCSLEHRSTYKNCPYYKKKKEESKKKLTANSSQATRAPARAASGGAATPPRHPRTGPTPFLVVSILGLYATCVLVQRVITSKTGQISTRLCVCVPCTFHGVMRITTY